jgi:hypothetical protein
MQDCKDGIPMPIVNLNRWTVIAAVVAALAFRQPLVTTALFAILAPAALFGSRASVIFHIGRRLFSKLNQTAEKEDRRLMRFNNTLAAVMLAAAQVCFALRIALLGWLFSCAVALAAAIALAGFCVGCFLFFRFKMMRYRYFET